jgi:hypothetical protein
MEPQAPPIGVTLLAVLFLITAAFSAVISGLFVFSLANDGAVFAEFKKNSAEHIRLATLLFLTFGFAVAGIGLFRQSPQGWNVATFLMMYSFMHSLGYLTTIAFGNENAVQAINPRNHGISFLYFQYATRSVLSILCYDYLYRSAVRAYFRTTFQPVLKKVLSDVGFCIFVWFAAVLRILG